MSNLTALEKTLRLENALVRLLNRCVVDRLAGPLLVLLLNHLVFRLNLLIHTLHLGFHSLLVKEFVIIFFVREICHSLRTVRICEKLCKSFVELHVLFRSQEELAVVLLLNFVDEFEHLRLQRVFDGRRARRPRSPVWLGGRVDARREHKVDVCSHRPVRVGGFSHRRIVRLGFERLRHGRRPRALLRLPGGLDVVTDRLCVVLFPERERNLRDRLEEGLVSRGGCAHLLQGILDGVRGEHLVDLVCAERRLVAHHRG
mmetsp:Transcript_11289/g.28596  ORF Transcript_11289/g.28596 Transcript_11289/m.28596 type:complete len:258 (+) Transcript_11289:59-832(+)